MNQQNSANFIWSVADLLRGDFKRSEYGRVILPFTLLRRLECVLEPTRDAVIERAKALESTAIDPETVLPKVAGQKFYNVSRYSLANVGETETRQNLEDYVAKFSPNAQEIFGHFRFHEWLDRLVESNLLFAVMQRFAATDRHPDVISNHEMGLSFVLNGTPT